MTSKLRHAVMFSIYSTDEKIVFPLVRFQCNPQDIEKCIKEGTFPLDEVKGFFEKAIAAATEAIKAGKENAPSTKKL